jgi:peptide/nickel transport system substrate-binding protein
LSPAGTDASTGTGRSRHHRAVGLLAVLAVGALVLAACGSSSKKPASAPSTSPTTSSAPVVTGSKLAGGTVTFAEGPSETPTYIFPMAGTTTFSTSNLDQLSYLLYRPLYWYGNNETPTVDYDYSLATAPVFSDGDKVVTINLKNWKWSNGTSVTSQDVEFWMNVLNSVKTTGGWGAYSPGGFPDNITKQSYPNASTVVFTLNKAYNPQWFLYNELSQITPLPLAWDETGAGVPSHCVTVIADCTAVYKYLNAQAQAITAWGTSPLWSVVDGPFKLTSATSDGRVTFVPNLDYSGSPKATVSQFIEVPFTSDTAEVDEMDSAGATGLNFGQIPDQDIPQTASIASHGYNAVTSDIFSFNFMPLNLNNPTDGALFKQLYFRQAFQHTVDQLGWIKAYLHGAAVPSYGPVPVVPKNLYADAFESSDPYPFNIAAAKTLLTSHGWTVSATAPATCTKPGSGAGECGAGIPAGFKISFNLDYVTGFAYVDQEMDDLKSDAAQVGIDLSLTEHPFSTVIAAAAPCTPTQASCKWTMENWGGGWVYSPDYLPTGEELYTTGAGSNYSSFTSPTADALINATTTGSATTEIPAIDSYENYIGQQLPVIFQPAQSGNPDSGGPDMISKHLGGVSFNIYAAITPETWYLTK